MTKKASLFVGAVLFFTSAFSQFTDSLHVEIGVAATLASKDYMPFWLVSNKWGTIADRQADLSPNIKLSNAHYFGGHRTTDTSGIKNNGLYIKYGLNAYLNNKTDDVFFEQLYLKAGYKNLELRVGRFEELIGVNDPDLSTGSLGISGNALPIPKIGLAITQFTDIPFTNGWVQFKGTFSNGWLGKDNYLKDAFLHEKSLHLRFGKSKFRVIVGGEHFAEWGGERPGLTLGRSFKSFMDAVLVKWKNDGSFANQDSTASFSGDQRIVFDGALEWVGDKVTVDIYQQSPFESKDGISFQSVDALRGVGVTFHKKTGITKVVGEFLYTKQMFDYVPIGYRPTYYNNWQYKTGWEYNGHIIGTPLFVNRVRGSHYFSDIKPFDWNAPTDSIPRNSNIISNRVVGFNVGLMGNFVKNLTSKFMLTYIQNYGTYDNTNGPFGGGASKKQFYGMLELGLPVPSQKLIFKSDIGFDFGDMTNNVGLMLSVLWKVK